MAEANPLISPLLLTFRAVVREGGLVRGAEQLGLSHPAVSAQIRQLEIQLGATLLEKQGRRLVPTEVGAMVYRRSQALVDLAEDLRDGVAAHAVDAPVRWAVGVAQALPKLSAMRALAPLMRGAPRVHLTCVEGDPARLLGDLVAQELDAVVADTAPDAALGLIAHPVAESPIGFFGRPGLVSGPFPRCLHGAPVVLPTRASALRGRLDAWFDEVRVRPEVVGSFDDSALMKQFAKAGHGLAPAAVRVRDDLADLYQLELVGVAHGVAEAMVVITTERRARHPLLARLLSG